MFVSKLPMWPSSGPYCKNDFFLFLAMLGVEEWSLQHIFSPYWGAKQAKTPHVALMNHPLITTIYFGTDNFTKTADILPVQDYM